MTPQNPFRTLAHRNFRLLWIGEILRTSAHWMDLLSRGLLVLQLTGSAADVALVTAARTLPLFVVGMWGGLLADRVDRRRLLLASRTFTVLAFAVLGVLVFVGWTPLWVVYVTAIILGFGQALNGPARQSLLPSLVPADELRSAVVLNTATLNVGQAIGPLLAGASIALAGLAPTFFLQGLLILIGGVLIGRMAAIDAVPKSREPLARSALDGLRYLTRHPLLLGLFAIGLVSATLVDPFRGVVPVLALEKLGADSALSGALLGALGAGALVAIALLAVFPVSGASWRLIVFGAIGFGTSVAVFSLSPSIMLSAAVLFVGGFAQACFRTQSQSLQLSETDDAYRGRVTSVWVIIRGTEPLGSVVLAGLTAIIGVTAAIGSMAAAGVMLVVIVAITASRMITRDR